MNSQMQKLKKNKVVIYLGLVIGLAIISLLLNVMYSAFVSEGEKPVTGTILPDNNSNKQYIAVFVDGIRQSVFPAKTSGKHFQGVTCTNGATAYFNPRTWSLKVESTAPTNCNVNFGTQSYCAQNNVTNLKDCLIGIEGGIKAIKDNLLPFSGAYLPKAETEAQTMVIATDDEYGETYVYRGHRDYLKNNVIFAGYQWKIVRINGDGSIRLVYNGIEAQFTSNGNTMNTTGANTNYELRGFNHSQPLYNAHVGFRAGSVNSGSYVSEHSNTGTNEIWNYGVRDIYDHFALQGTTFTSKIADNLFCGDRTMVSPGYPSANTGLGYGTNATYYSAYLRVVQDQLPTLKCPNENDQYTSSSSAIGNKALGTRMIGLLSVDEVMFAGAVHRLSSDDNNTAFYLYSGQAYWTMSPAYYSTNAYEFMIGSTGGVGSSNVGSELGVRPVINLKSTVTIVSGDGSANNPYRV